ncbi:hypothetical protein EV421DRAFT_1723027, partial [Armillaria borealis]
LQPDEKEPLLPGNPAEHYQISNSKHYPLDLNLWLNDHEGDVALTICLYHKIMTLAYLEFQLGLYS